VLAALHAVPDGLSLYGLERAVNISHGRIEKTLLLMSFELPAPVTKVDNKWQLTVADLSPAFWKRAERLTTLRQAEQEQMRKYAALTTGHMEFLIAALDGPPGKRPLPNLSPLPVTISPALVQEALFFLRRTNLPLEPRVRWPNGGLARMKVQGLIPAERQAQPGKILCAWGDAGWGDRIRRGKHEGHFADELVLACVELFKKWSPQPAPTWVTCIPSRNQPDLVPDFARRLAIALNLPFHIVLEKTDDRPQQKTMANSSQQAGNIDGSLKVGVQPPNQPVLLVDDMVDSRWTLTVAAYLLTTRGSGLVYPLALASTAHAE
jgi:ATP-dependent DNA helicase RecQ